MERDGAWEFVGGSDGHMRSADHKGLNSPWPASDARHDRTPLVNTQAMGAIPNEDSSHYFLHFPVVCCDCILWN
ncbi:hypothetical protein TSOC_003819 [Tetrabaena socialis]|uniref:Uncharacterized protein n=1 Tax=Tetrabaena socialis TaxID=47790 RepID=A0A2J8AAN3_9CHLO|nr:hypothetical protein TSOC_003819 [Tetrabaena socialis]|eukprot:PNH09575.1 hypothetical protein TSOC_003819 [Tetrabaena socialis]